ncbi:hypothetical protein B0O80DRAFT_471819, partial [Mortierella sp. GBAus27b]
MAIREHFGRLPVLITKKLVKIGSTDVPQLEYTDKDGDGEDNEDTDDILIEESKLRFKTGHVKQWWKYYISLPAELRPVFCSTASLKDTFNLFQETAFVALLWQPGTKTNSALSKKVFGRDEADRLAKEDYGAVIHRLFIGDAKTIKSDPTKSQTTYGKRSTTMGQLAIDAPDKFGIRPMRDYLDEHFAYLKRRHNPGSTPSAQLTPPPLPNASDSYRYAISNILQTDGLRVNVTAFDIKRQWVSSNAKIKVPDMETRFPDRSSIKAALGDPKKVTVVGVDPGQIISASFCGLNPQKPDSVTNLHIKRAALYAPTHSHRQALQSLKRIRPVVTQSATIDPSIWISPTQFNTSEGCFEVPSIQELESSLPDRNFTSVEDYKTGLQRWWDLHDALTGFYGSTKLKKWTWELSKANRAEQDMAFNGALKVANPLGGAHLGPTTPTLFIYG